VTKRGKRKRGNEKEKRGAQKDSRKKCGARKPKGKNRNAKDGLSNGQEGNEGRQKRCSEPDVNKSAQTGTRKTQQV